LTKEGLEIASPDTLQLKVGSTIIPCIPSATGSCDYSTSTTTNLPIVTLITKDSADTIKFEGTGFQTLAGFSAKAKYLNIEATSVDVQSDFLALAIFDKGVPLSAIPQKAFLYFQDQLEPIQHYAVNTNFTNAATVTALDSAVSCSYAGGCSISISQSGLLANLLSDSAKNNIRVCGQLCKLDVAGSNSNQVVCNLPALATTASID